MREWLHQFWLRVMAMIHRRRLDRDLQDELTFHLDMRAETGAHRRFGNVALLKESCRDLWTFVWLETILQDLRYGVRMLRRSPAFTAVAVLSLALGIGANTAIFSLINAVLLRPLPVPQPQGLVELAIRPRDFGVVFSYPLFDFVRRHNQVFSGVFAWTYRSFQVKVADDTQKVWGVLASGEYFQTLGTPPQIGRAITPADDVRAGGSQGPVVVISDRFWSSRFGRQPTVLGQTLRVNGVAFTVVGVMPAEFFGAEIGTWPDIFVPVTSVPAIYTHHDLDGRDAWWLMVMARLKPEVSIQQAQAQLDALSPEMFRTTLPEDRDAEDRKTYLAQSLSMIPASTGFTFLRMQFSNPLAVLMILVGLVLLIACANLASLLLARTTARVREITVRLAVGAGRTRIVRQLLTESLLLAAAGGSLGMLTGVQLTSSLASFLPAGRGGYVLDLQPDDRVLAFLLSITLLTALLFGTAPALRATRVALQAGLKEAAPTVAGRHTRFSGARWLLAGQVAVSVILVAGAGLFIGSLRRLRTIDPGFDSNQLYYYELETGRLSEKGESLAALYGRVMERVHGFPGIADASLAGGRVICGCAWTSDVSLPGNVEVPRQLRQVHLNSVGPRYFATMRTPLIAGRDFDANDTETSPRVIVLNQEAARAYFPDGTAVGKRVMLNKEPLEVVGIVGNAKYMSLREQVPRTFYLPYTQNVKELVSMNVVVRARGDVSVITSVLRSIVREEARGVPVPEPKSLDEQIDESISMERLMASLSLYFGALALLLTSVGLYGSLAYAVSRRTPEIGVRMALGAGRWRVMRLVLRENAGLMVAGLCVGIGVSLALSRLIASLLYGITPHDPLALSLSVVVLAVVGAMASLLPALRASRIDPMVALRSE